MNINIIIACDPTGTIGKNGDLPWDNLPGELKKFRDTTLGHVMVMGRNTFESLPMYPNGFPGRDNVVVSSLLRKSADICCRLNGYNEHIQSFKDIEIPHSAVTASGTAFFQWLKGKYEDRSVFICGGKALVEMMLPHIYAGDVKIPKLPEILYETIRTRGQNEKPAEWEVGSSEEFDDYTTYKLIKIKK